MCVSACSVCVSGSSPHVVQAWAVGPWAQGPTVWSTWSYSASCGPPSASSLQAGSTAYLAWGGTSGATKRAHCQVFLFAFSLVQPEVKTNIMSWKKENAVDLLFLLVDSSFILFFMFPVRPFINFTILQVWQKHEWESVYSSLLPLTLY